MPTISFTEQELRTLAQQLQPYMTPAPPAEEPPVEEPPQQPPVEPPPVQPGNEPRGTVGSLVLDADIGIVPPWAGARVVAPDRIQRVTSPRRAGTHAYRIEVRPGDKPSSSGERAELFCKTSGHIPDGAIYYMGWSTLLPEDWKSSSSYQIIYQLHGVGDSLSPAVSIRAASNGFVLRMRGGTDASVKKDVVLAPLNLGKWNDFVVAAKSSPLDSEGWIRVWHRMEGGTWKKVADLRIATAASHRKGQYLRQGLYRSGDTFTNILYHDCMRVGNSLAEAAAGFPDKQPPRWE